MEKTHLYAYICFTGKEDKEDFPLEVVTKKLNVQPTTTQKFREIANINPLRLYNFTSWKFESEELETLDTNDVLLPILNTFQSKVQLINEIKEELDLDVRIELVITMIDGYTPGLVISPEFSHFASAIGAFIGVDMYVKPFSESEEY